MLRILLILLFLGLATLVPIYFPEIVTWMVINLKAGWVFSTIFIRFIVIILFVLALNLIFSYFNRTRKIRFPYVFMIGMIPGFGLSFVSPIYNTDYGDLSDDMELNSPAILQEYTKNKYNVSGERHIVAFFSTGCGHCQNVAAKIGINQRGGQSLSVWSFFMEEPTAITEFLGACYGQEFDAFQMKNQEIYFEISGFEVPSVFLIDRDGSTMKHWAGDVVNYTALDYLKEIEP